ncbi:MAG: cytochrome ubiquinol oxidase subunit I, partial [Candidatus Tectomicrobia bacterium]
MTISRRFPATRAFFIGLFALFMLVLTWEVAQGASDGFPLQEAPSDDPEYRDLGGLIRPRVFMWVVAELHLMFAAFVLAVPMFALIIEFIGYKTGDTRYDDLAYDFTKLLSVSFSFTATLGALLTFGLIILYPGLTQYLVKIFSWTFLPYVLLFFFEAIFLYSYYYGWGKMNPKLHLFLGVMLNIVGTSIMFIA